MQNTKTFRSMGNLTTPSAPGGVFCCRTHTRVAHTYVGVYDEEGVRGWVQARVKLLVGLSSSARKGKKTSSVMCDAWHFSQFMCLYLIRRGKRGRGRLQKWLPKGVAVWQQERETETEKRERETEGEEAARQWGWKLKPKLRRKTFQWPPKLSLNTNVTPNASFYHAPSPSTHTLTHLPLPLRAHVINFKWKWILWQLKFSWRFFGSSSAWHTRIHPQTHAHTHVVSVCVCVCVYKVGICVCVAS